MRVMCVCTCVYAEICQSMEVEVWWSRRARELCSLW